MSVIAIVQGNPNPSETAKLQEYQKVARPIIAKLGGEIVARGSGLRSLAGSGKWQTGIVIRFPDEAAAQAWINDPDYQRVLPLRSSGYSDLEIHLFQE
jgi:uncharacterized protein (DUF1330 family)